MADYSTIDKTAWFINKMRSGWFSRPEIVELAAKEFPSVPRKTLDGTIGQYWSDSVNPKWGTYKAIQARRLKVVEDGGRRRIVEATKASSPILNDWVSKRNVTIAHRPAARGPLQMADPLVNFDWASLYRRYDASCRRFDSRSLLITARDKSRNREVEHAKINSEREPPCGGLGEIALRVNDLDAMQKFYEEMMLTT